MGKTEVFGMSNRVVYMATTSCKVSAFLREMSVSPVPCSLPKCGFAYEFTVLYVDTVAIWNRIR